MTKGFTLIELLIVIGILAILATTVVLVLNPAKILQESRDTQRLSDLSAVQSAIGLVVATAGDPAAAFKTSATPQVDIVGPFCTFVAATAQYTAFTSTSTCAYPGDLSDNVRKTDGSGWVGVNFGLVSGGTAPLSSLPVDPTNDVLHFYSYRRSSVANATTYEINARLESEKQGLKMGEDGGNKNNCGSVGALTLTNDDCWYEIGNSPGLSL